MENQRRNKRWSDTREPVAWVPNSPDGGWGWVVVFGSLMIHVFADGFVYSFGIMIVELLEQFQEGKALTSWIISTLIGLTLGAGPVASAVTHRFGCRFTTILGAVIASTGCAVSFLATSVAFLMVSVGVIMGFGFGLMYCPAIIIVTVYFEEKRAFATGLAVCGAGIGTFIFSPLSTYLINIYTWRGAFLIYSGIILNCAACGALFRPLEFVPVYEEEEEDGDAEEMTSSNLALDHKISETEEKWRNGELGGLINGTGQSCTHIPRPSPPKVTRTLSHGGSDRGFLESPPGPGAKLGRRQRGVTVSESSGYLGMKDAFFQGSFTSINLDQRIRKSRPEFRSITSIHRAVHGPVHTVRVKKSVEEYSEEIMEEKTEKRGRTVEENFIEGWKEFKSIIAEMFNPSLLSHPLFLLFSVSNFLTSLGFNAPLVFLPDRAVEELGVAKNKASLSLSAFGVANTVGRILIGFLSDRTWACRYGRKTENNRLWIYIVSLAFSGTITLFMFLCRDFTSVMIYAATFGLSLSSYICLTSVILVDLLGMDKLTNAFGLLLLFQGIASLIGPPMAGWIVDATHNYDYSFVFAGICIAVSGLMLFLIPCLKKKLKVNSKLRKKSSSAYVAKNPANSKSSVEMKPLNNCHA